jgi:sRNA-binding carbon storage regulator CsrA
MLVMSRQVGQSVRVGGSVDLTLTAIGRDFADFRLVEDEFGLKQVRLVSDRLEAITNDVTAILIGLKAPNGVRIGLEFPRHVSVQRIDD